MPGGIKKEMQLAVDRYVSVFAEYKAMKDELDELRELIEPYMKDNEVKAIESSDGKGKVELTQQERASMSARYTTYNAEEISALLPPSVRKKCLVEVVDKEKLEALHKLGEVPSDVISRKVTKLTYSFAARIART